MKASLTFKLERMASPVGTLLIVTDGEARLRALHWEEDELHLLQRLRRHYGAGTILRPSDGSPSAARKALEAYFAGDLHGDRRHSRRNGGHAVPARRLGGAA